MDKILEKSLLYDFYGELLTDHQKMIYEQFILEDLSLGEIAVNFGISRQGVHDIIKRCKKTLNEYEEKLHLVAKFLSIKSKICQIEELANIYGNKESQEFATHIIKIANEIIEEL